MKVIARVSLWILVRSWDITQQQALGALRTFLRPPKVPMRASHRPLWPDTPRYRDLPRVKALLLRRTYATMFSYAGG